MGVLERVSRSRDGSMRVASAQATSSHFANVDVLVHHDDRLGIAELRQHAPQAHHHPPRLSGIGFSDRDDGHAIGAGLGRQPDIDDLRHLPPHGRQGEIVEDGADHRRLVGRTSGEGGQIDRVAAHGDGGNAHHREILDAVVIAGVIAVRPLGRRLGRGSKALDDDFGVGGNHQRDGQGGRNARAFAAQHAGKTQFREGFRQWKHRGEQGRRIAADGHRHRHVLAAPAPLAMMRGAAAMRQPAQDGAILAERLHPIDADIHLRGVVGVRVRRPGDDQRPGDQRRGFAGPAGLDRDFQQIDIGAQPAFGLAIRPRHRLRPRRQRGMDHRPAI